MSLSSYLWRRNKVRQFVLTNDSFMNLRRIPGIFSSSLHEADLIIPRKVNSDGEHVSHNLIHHHEHDYYEGETGEPEDHMVHYRIDLHNETLHLEME